MRKTKVTNILYILIGIVFIVNSINRYVYADNILARTALVIDSSNEKNESLKYPLIRQILNTKYQNIYMYKMYKVSVVLKYKNKKSTKNL